MNINNGVKRWEVNAFVHPCWTKTETMKRCDQIKENRSLSPWGWMVPILKMRRFSCLLRLSEGKFSSLDLFVRQCRHDIDRLNHSRRKRPSNLSTDELSAFKSLRSRNDVVIKPADKGGAVVVWGVDLYRQETLRQLKDASFYTKLNSDPTFSHQKLLKPLLTISFKPAICPPLLPTCLPPRPEHLSYISYLKFTSLIILAGRLSPLAVVLLNSYPAF